MAAKINDGLFIGDFETSQDVEFLDLNKISSLVNLAGHQLPNIFASQGMVYMTLEWEDREDFELFPPGSTLIKEIVQFVDRCHKHGTSVLFFSVEGIGRCAAAASCYLMYKYGWGFEKTYDFIFSKKPDLDVNRGFVEQLFKLDKDLRRQKYSSLLNISQLENERLTGWDPEYVKASLESATTVAAYNVAMEELLMVNSYNNSKLTISSLPGPYQDAMLQHKNFKLQFNLLRNQEAGVHLKRTQPLSPSKKPARGILKGGQQYISRSEARKMQNASKRSPSPSRNNSNSCRVLEDSSDEDDDNLPRRGRQSPAQENKVSHNLPQEDSMMFGGSISLLSAGKDEDSRYIENPVMEQSNSDYFDKTFQPQESIQSQNSQGSDLYDFVGLQSNSKTSSSNYMDMLSLDSSDVNDIPRQPRRREAKDASRRGKSTSSGGFQDRRVRRTESKQSQPSQTMPVPRSNAATPEERLHSLLGDLQRGGGSKKTVQHRSPDEFGENVSNPFESGSKYSGDGVSSRYEAKRASGGADSRLGATVHDIANMNIQPAYHRNGMSVSGQPVRARPHTTAWGERSERSRVQSERKQKTAKQYRSNTAGSTYRHGSPAPQVPPGGLSSRVKQTGRDSSPGRQPMRRNGSDVQREKPQAPRYSTPTRSSSRQREPLTSTSAPSARRHGTPTRERHQTPPRQRPSTPERSGWRY